MVAGVTSHICYWYWNPCFRFCFWGKPKIREWTNQCQVCLFVCFNLQYGANNLWSPQAFICELPTGKDRTECEGIYGGSSGHGKTVNAETRIWKGLREKLDREKTVGVESWSLERGSCMPPICQETPLVRNADCKCWKPQETLSFFKNWVWSDLLSTLFCLCRLGYTQLFRIFPPRNSRFGVFSCRARFRLSTFLNVSD